MNKRNLRGERKRKRSQENKMYISKAAEKVIIRKGYSAMTMDDVAEESQFSKATIYRYYKSKGELIIDIVASYLEDLVHQIARIKAEKINAKTKLNEVIHCVARFHKEKGNISRIFIMDEFFMKRIRVFLLDKQKPSSDHEEKFFEMVKARRKQIFKQVYEVLAEGVEAGEFNEINVPEAVTFLESALQGFCHGKLWRDKRYSLDHEADLIHGYFLHGIERKDNQRKGD
jgi:AcrR family transcriptional regulator